MEALQGVDLADSLILGWSLHGEQLIIEIDCSLWPNHPGYNAGTEGQVACYRNAKLCFPNVQAVEGLIPLEKVKPQASEDGFHYGPIDYFAQKGPGVFFLSGELGDVELESDEPYLEFTDK